MLFRLHRMRAYPLPPAIALVALPVFWSAPPGARPRRAAQ